MVATQTEFDNFIQRAAALKAQIGYSWIKARDEGSRDEAKLYAQFKYLKYTINAICTFEVGATDNLLSDEEVEVAYEQINLIGNLCDTNYLLNDTI